MPFEVPAEAFVEDAAALRKHSVARCLLLEGRFLTIISYPEPIANRKAVVFTPYRMGVSRKRERRER
ncbi:MAG: hypothetical protein KatS3mg115_0921 [Candidatus Poribacteria bacterium]|nr:MAG: hypothetical protein KatS3mg115_0921 [Candidatus Poribacteria bacterium]